MGPEFTPDRVAERLAQSAASRLLGPPPSFSSPVVIDEGGYAWVPHPNPAMSSAEVILGCYVHAGIRLGWAPMPLPLPGGVLLTLFGGGPPPDARFEESGVAAFITRSGLEALIADLQAIAASIEPQS